jgi:hypothetical protein
MHRPLRLLGLLGCALAGLGCTGNIDQGAGGSNTGNGNTGNGNTGNGNGNGNGNTGGVKPPTGSMTPGDPMAGALGDKDTVPGTNPLRRLTLLEYQNTVHDLLGIDPGQVSLAGLAGDQESSLSGYVKGSTLTTGQDARALMASAEGAAKLIAGNLTKILPCSPLPTAASDQDACVDKFIPQFGLRAFRRPLSTGEVDALRQLYQQQRGPSVGAAFDQAVVTLVGTMLQSPMFLYHWEIGPVTPIREGNLIRYNPYEIASKLSYLFWSTMPDDKLFELARQGGLTAPDQIAAEAKRLVADPRAKTAIADFHFQWLEIAGLVDMPKDTSFKDYSPAVAAAMTEETRQFVSDVFFGPKPTLETLFTSTTSFVDPALGKIYGTTVTGTGMQKVTLNPAQRSGLLTQGSFLAVKADAGDSLPPRRGDAILHRALCIELEVPPNIVVPAVAEPNAMQTTRQRFEVHGQADCAKACHAFIDPVGFAFENYDAVGAYRTMENNQKVDASGTIDLPVSGKVSFQNAIEFSAILAKAPEVQDCMVRQWVRYALGRRELQSEEPSFKVLQSSFKTSGYNIRDMLVAITKTRAFTHRALSAGEAQ